MIEHLSSPPLARRLGDAVHVSPLLRRICQISGCSEDRVGEWLLKCAVRSAVFPKTFRPTILT
jgi:hypothetical protein